ncbi:Protein of unknown function [Bacillus cereus]|nr:Protein of unknown function [Bacillus cereus]
MLDVFVYKNNCYPFSKIACRNLFENMQCKVR